MQQWLLHDVELWFIIKAPSCFGTTNVSAFNRHEEKNIAKFSLDNAITRGGEHSWPSKKGFLTKQKSCD
jgi:hypothetical protein